MECGKSQVVFFCICGLVNVSLEAAEMMLCIGAKDNKFRCHFPCISSSIKREKRPPSPEDDDVIILSDDSPSPPMNGLSHFKELDTDLLMVRHPPHMKVEVICLSLLSS